jgi:hypothetical protein
MKGIKETALIMLETNPFEEVLDWVISKMEVKHESQLAAEREWKNKILTEVHTAYENLFLGHTELAGKQLSMGHTELAGKQLSKLISNLK